MVRYSISMDDTLTEKIDKACEQKKISRSDWISEACTGHLTTRAVNPACTLPAPVPSGTTWRTTMPHTGTSGSMSPVLQLRF